MLSFVLNDLPQVFYLSKRALSLHSSSTPTGQNTPHHRATETESSASANLPAAEQRRARSVVTRDASQVPPPAHGSSSRVGALQRPPAACPRSSCRSVERGCGKAVRRGGAHAQPSDQTVGLQVTTLLASTAQISLWRVILFFPYAF